MGLALMLAAFAALAGGAGTCALFDAAARLRRSGKNRNLAAACAILTALCAAFTLWMTWTVLDILDFAGLF